MQAAKDKGDKAPLVEGFNYKEKRDALHQRNMTIHSDLRIFRRRCVFICFYYVSSIHGCGISATPKGVHVVSGTLRGPCSHDCNGWVRVLLFWVNAVLSARRFELSSSVRNAYHSRMR